MADQKTSVPTAIRMRVAPPLAAVLVLTTAGCSLITGSVSLTVGGRDQNVDGWVTCSDHSGGSVVDTGDSPHAIYLDVAPAHSGVRTLSLGDSTGRPLVAKDGASLAWADGSYDISGQAVPKDEPDAANAVPFHLSITCP